MLKCLLIVVAGVLSFGSTVVGAEQNALVLDLRSATQLALRTSPQLGSAAASSDVAKAQIGKAKSAMYPNVVLESGYNYLSEPTLFGTTPILETNTQNNRIALQQTIYSGGSVQANVARTRYGYAAASQGAKAAEADLISNVGAAYFRARQAEETVSVAEANVNSLKASYDAAQKLHESGVVTKSDVLRAEVALASANNDLISAVNNHNVALAALRTAIGLPHDARIELARQPNDSAPETASSVSPAPRPEIAAAAASLEAAGAAAKAARAGKLPTVALTADFFNEPVGAQFPRLTNTVMAGVMVRFNALDGGLTRANIDEADAARRKAAKDLEAEQRHVELEQQAAKLNLDSATARVETTATQVRSAEESLRSLQAGYLEGITPLTDVLSAQTALTAARVSRLAALYDVKIAQVNLLRAYGQADVLAR